MVSREPTVKLGTAEKEDTAYKAMWKSRDLPERRKDWPTTCARTIFTQWSPPHGTRASASCACFPSMAGSTMCELSSQACLANMFVCASMPNDACIPIWRCACQYQRMHAYQHGCLHWCLHVNVKGRTHTNMRARLSRLRLPAQLSGPLTPQERCVVLPFVAPACPPSGA